ncbi:hypothetical protein BD779DRAFT_1478773 [Infundibulicybe gibba]|nr:hypothetical protein BD779DRAFT_1478773 [Infundibulicybe gibba]
MSYNLVLSCLGVLDLPLLLSLRLIGHWSLSSTQVLLVASTFTIQYILQGLRADAFLESFQSVGFTWCMGVGRFFLAAAAPLPTIKLLIKASPKPRLGTIGKTLNGEFGTPVADRLPNCIFLIEGHCGGDEFGAAKSADIIAVRVLHDPGCGLRHLLEHRKFSNQNHGRYTDDKFSPMPISPCRSHATAQATAYVSGLVA